MNRRIPNAASGFFAAAQKTCVAVAKVWRTVVVDDQPRPYRPELYYMRGPGPKWREKQAQCRHSTVQ
jgi:hypothetical protein